MNIIKDDSAQTSAEFLMLFGGVIIIVIVFAIVYRNYVKGLGNQINSTDLQNVTQSINNLTSKFS
jgi:uncharacterized protein (UPF0333 family)